MSTEPDERHENVADGVPQPGAVVAGSYHVDRVIGQGGMGVVLGAHHERLGHAVAIKVLYLESVGDSAAVGRFLREAQSALQIRSEHVARVFDVGALDSGAPYMVMEMLDGTDLEQLVERSGPLPLEVAVDYVLQASEALAEAHVLGIVHRDIKPSNLFLTERADGTPLVKVLDFGIAKRVTTTGSEAALTVTGTALGTPAFMAPEQIRNAKGVDARADIWGLGTVLFHLLTGGPPFSGQTLPAVCAMIVADPTPSIRASRPELPAAFEQLMGRCLEKSPTHRFQNLAELARALAPFAPKSAAESIHRIARIVSARGAQPTDAADSSEEPTVERPPGAREAGRPAPVEAAGVDGSLDVTLQKPASIPPGAAVDGTGAAPSRARPCAAASSLETRPTTLASSGDEPIAGVPTPPSRWILWAAAGVVLLGGALVAIAMGGSHDDRAPLPSSDPGGNGTALAPSSASGAMVADRPTDAGSGAMSTGDPTASSSAADADRDAALGEPAPSRTATTSRPRAPTAPSSRPSAAPSATATGGSVNDGVLGDRK